MDDPAAAAITVVSDALLACFRPDSNDPPVSGSSTVHFFAGEGPATAAWNPSDDDQECEVILWIRLASRYRTRTLPNTAVEPNNCRLRPAAEIEVGVGRCTLMAANPSWDEYHAEAVEATDDSRRLEVAACAALTELTARDYVCVSEPVLPFGPEGGTIGWSVVLHVQF